MLGSPSGARTDQAAGAAGGQPAARRRSACGSACSTTSRPPTTAPGSPARRLPGVLVEVTTRADGAPPVPGPLGDIDLNGDYVGTIQLGASGASAGATNFDDEVIAAGGGHRRSTSPSTRGFVPTDAGVVDARRRHRPSDAAPPTPAAAGSASQQLLRRVVDTFGGRLGLLYLAFGFAVLGLCLVPRLTLPARLPGAQPVTQGASMATDPPPASEPDDDEPDPKVLWGWVATSVRPWLGWILIGVGALLMLLGYLGVSREALAGQADPVPRVGRHRRHVPRRARRLLPRHPGAAQGQRPARPARADGRGAAPGAAPPARRARPHRPDAVDATGRRRARPARKVFAVEGADLFHRSGCAMVDGKDADELTPAAARKQGLRPCPLCTPGAGAADRQLRSPCSTSRSRSSGSSSAASTRCRPPGSSSPTRRRASSTSPTSPSPCSPGTSRWQLSGRWGVPLVVDRADRARPVRAGARARARTARVPAAPGPKSRRAPRSSSPRSA